MDYRPLLEYFIADLLAVLNLPEWPASELMLTVLGRILVCHWLAHSLLTARFSIVPLCSHFDKFVGTYF